MARSSPTPRNPSSPSTSGLKPTREAFKIGQKKYGAILKYPGRPAILEIARSRRDIFLDRQKRINHAIEEEVACWSVETVILSRMRMRKIPLLAIRMRDDGDVFLTTLQNFIDHSHMRNRRIRNGSPQRSLPFRHFRRKPGRVKL